jgi:hypothetical protein
LLKFLKAGFSGTPLFYHELHGFTLIIKGEVNKNTGDEFPISISINYCPYFQILHYDFLPKKVILSCYFNWGSQFYSEIVNGASRILSRIS